jgi:phosphotransferase system enzyme I (PtsP)
MLRSDSSPPEELSSMEQSPVPPGAQLHGQHDGQVDRVLDYLDFVAHSRPLSELLDEAPRKIADCVDARVASLYLLEGDGRLLVMRGNVGFPASAQGTVRLAVGEGITGTAVALAYPISTAQAEEHASYRPFPELGEERFPVLLAAPIAGPLGPLGAVVLQREKDRPFSEAEVCLVAALTAPIASAIRLARLLDDLRSKPARGAGAGTRKVTLPGMPVVGGRSLGAIAALRRPALSPREPAGEQDLELFLAALDSADKALRELESRARKRGLDAEAAFFESHRLMCQDQRLRRRSVEQLQQGAGIAQALGTVAREATRTATERKVPFLIERARDLEQLCNALAMMASPDVHATPPAKAIVVADQLSVYDLLVTARAQPVGFVLTERAPNRRTRTLLELLAVPSISDVVGAFRWVAPGDIAVLDADHGFLFVNPSRADIAAHKAARRARERASRARG